MASFAASLPPRSSAEAEIDSRGRERERDTRDELRDISTVCSVLSPGPGLEDGVANVERVMWDGTSPADAAAPVLAALAVTCAAPSPFLRRLFDSAQMHEGWSLRQVGIPSPLLSIDKCLLLGIPTFLTTGTCIKATLTITKT